jgi:hypothetical protein
MTPLDPILHELADEHREQSAPETIERALVAEFRSRHRRSLLPWLGGAAAVAPACAALAVYLVQPPPAEMIALHVAAPAAPEVRFTPKRVEAPRVAVARAKRSSAPAGAEITTDFFPLRAGPVLAPGELVQIVRTRVPRRELARFGLTASGYDTSRPVARDIRADVVFGYDGTARAIRFIHDSQ